MTKNELKSRESQNIGQSYSTNRSSTVEDIVRASPNKGRACPKFSNFFYVTLITFKLETEQQNLLKKDIPEYDRHTSMRVSRLVASISLKKV